MYWVLGNGKSTGYISPSQDNSNPEHNTTTISVHQRPVETGATGISQRSLVWRVHLVSIQHPSSTHQHPVKNLTAPFTVVHSERKYPTAHSQCSVHSHDPSLSPLQYDTIHLPSPTNLPRRTHIIASVASITTPRIPYIPNIIVSPHMGIQTHPSKPPSPLQTLTTAPPPHHPRIPNKKPRTTASHHHLPAPPTSSRNTLRKSLTPSLATRHYPRQTRSHCCIATIKPPPILQSSSKYPTHIPVPSTPTPSLTPPASSRPRVCGNKNYGRKRNVTAKYQYSTPTYDSPPSKHPIHATRCAQ